MRGRFTVASKAAVKRIGILQVWQESNHFNPVRTDEADFRHFGYGEGPPGLDRFASGEEVGGFVEGLEAWGDQPDQVGLMFAQAWPSGPLTSSTKAWLVERLEHQLRAAGPLDGVLFSLHGALVAEDNLDVDGLLLEQVRSSLGPDVPLVATLDLHAHLTGRMLQSADVLVAYHTSPHIDRRRTGCRAAAVLERLLDGARPSHVAVRVPMLATGEQATTSGPALAGVFQRVQQMETDPRILSAAVLMVQPHLDVPKLGWSTLVCTDQDPALAEQWAEELAEQCWQARSQLQTQYTFHDATESVERALGHAGKPVIIADGADSTNSGAPGDSVHLLRELAHRSIPDGALTIMVDPDAVAHAQSVGEGGRFAIAVGGKRDHIFSQPLPVEGRVLFVRPAQYVLSGHGADALPIDMGLAAAIRIGDVTLLLVERVGPGSSPMMYRCVGLEPKDFKIVVVKSPAGFRHEFEPFAAGIVLSACPGCASPHLSQLPYRRISRPLWPLDNIQDRHAAAWCPDELRPP